MKVEKTFTVQASPQTVWDFAKDPEKMAPCVPGCKEIIAVDETHYKARVAVKVGPISAKFNLDLEIVEETPPVEIISKTRRRGRHPGKHVDSGQYRAPARQ